MRLERLIADAAQRDPDHPAVKDDAGALTYAELDALAGRAARGLAELGVGRGDRVAIWTSKSARAVAAMQAALRLGAAYVPLDPLSPQARAETIMRDCEVRALVGPAEHPSLPILRWDDVEALDPLPPAGGSEDELAYILYTSGSTGMPKGVCISHRNAMAFVEWAAREVDARPDDCFSNHAPFHFDLSVFDLYSAFLAGALVAIIPEAHAYAPAALVDFVVGERISVCYAVPSALILMLDRGGLLERDDLALRAVVFAGEPFPIKPLRRLRDGLPHVRMFNWYGPTETNVCTGYEVRAIEPDRETPVPIGHAVSGDEVWVEDGELVVAGPTVALGYWGHPPQGDAPYRTGDMVRLDEDGEYVYLGRRDHMVKIRGNRVELGEVEAALLAHPDVDEAVVVVEGSGLEARLVAFVAGGGEEPSLLELKRQCAERVPRHMIIDDVRHLGELPRTRNGKLDRLALQRLTEEVGP